MAREKIIAGIDIGASKIRTVIGILDPEKKEPHIIGAGVSPSLGLRKGAVVDIDEVIANISASLEDAERISGIPVHHVFVGIGGPHIEATDSRGVIAIGGKEISEDDLNRVLEAAEAVSMPQNRRILRIIPKSFSVDEQKGIRSPIGMSAIRLEVDAHIITGQSQIVDNIERCVHQAGVDIDDFVPSSLAAAEAVLSRRQKELGVVSINIGADSTSVVIYEDGAILYSATIPVGGSSVTNDIAIGLRSSIDTAEKIKIEHGTCLPEEISERETIDLALLSKIDKQKVSKKHLAEIIQARYHEIFIMIKDELRNISRDGMLPAGAILSGAGVKTSGVSELAREVLGLPVQIGFPQEISGVVDRIDDPSYSTAVGLVLWGSRFEGKSYSLSFANFNKAFSSVGSFFKKLLP
ncbi:MAG: cell division protein FtsA [Candidatus Gracilibacteria bacterium]|jgi:cell division protein FtsA|nr:cell division protein FtsA [Candidatus Gracilibacteria bacterium]